MVYSKGQSTMEYAIFFMAIAAVFSAMAIYARRGVQGVVKDFADQIADQQDAEKKLSPVPGTVTMGSSIVTKDKVSLLNSQDGGQVTISSSVTKTSEAGDGDVVTKTHSVAFKGME